MQFYHLWLSCSTEAVVQAPPPTVSFSSQSSQVAVKLLVKTSGELLMAHDCSLDFTYIDIKYNL